MKKVSILLYLFLSYALAFGQSEKSDSLFAVGVELYNQGNYEDAIPYFSASDALDKQELDSISPRRNYSSHWLAACYGKIGDVEMAKSIDSTYYYPPVDRRLTIQSDSLNLLAEQSEDIEQKLKYLRQSAELESKILGRSHYYRANSLELISFFEIAGFVDSLESTIKEIGYIAQHCRYWRMSPLILGFTFQALLKNSEYDKLGEIIEMFIKIVEPSAFDSVGTEFDGVYGQLLKTKAELLGQKDEYDELFKFMRHEYDKFNNENIINYNYYHVLCLYANSAFSIFIKNKDNDIISNEMESLRVKLYDELISLSSQMYGENSFEYANSLVKKANLYCGLGKQIDIQQGKYYLQKGCDILVSEELCSSRFEEVVDLILGEDQWFDWIGESESYLKYVDRILSYAPEDYDSSTILEKLADSFKSNDKKEEALAIYDKLINYYEGQENIIKSSSMHKAKASCLKQMELYDLAIEEYLKYDSLCNIFLDKENLVDLDTYANSLVDKSVCYLQAGDSDNYEKTLDQYSTLEEMIIEKMIKGEDASTPIYKYPGYRDMFRIETVKRYASVCIDREMSLYGDISSSYFLGGKKKKNISIEKARKYYTVALRFVEESDLSENEKNDYLNEFNSQIGTLYTYEQNFDSAYFYLNKVLDNTNPSEERYIITLSKMADLYQSVSIEPELSLKYRFEHSRLLSDYVINQKNAISPYEFMTLFEMVKKEWMHCADQFDYLGDYDGSFKCYDQLLSTINQVEGDKSIDYLVGKIYQFSGRISYFRWQKKDYQKSRCYCDSLCNFYESNYELLKDYPYYDYSSIGREYYYNNDSILAEYYFNKHETEIIKNYPHDYKQNKSYIEIQEFRADQMNGGTKNIQLYDVAALYKNVPEFKDNYLDILRTIYNRSKDSSERLKLIEEIFNSNPNWKGWQEAYLYNDLIKEYLVAKKYDKIVPVYSVATEKERNYIFEEFSSSAEDEREYMWEEVSKNPFTLAEPLITEFPGEIPTSIVYDNLLMRKNLLLNSSIAAINLIKTEGDTLLLAKYNRALDLKESLLETENDSIINNGVKISRIQAETLVSRFNKEIMERAAIIGDYTRGLDVRWQDIQNALNLDDISIEFSYYESFNEKKYYAAVLLTNEGNPLFIPLFEEDELLKIKNNYYTTNELGQILWEPLKEFISNKKNIYFSPDGQLYNIAIESVPYWDDATILMTDKWNIYRLSSTKELAMIKEKNLSKIATVYGGIKYDTDADILLADSRKYSRNRSLDITPLTIADSLDLRSGVKYLPATKVEAVEIENTLANIMNKTVLLTDSVGTEASFKDLSGKKNCLIHIATHGFYWTEQEAKFRDDLRFINVSKNNNHLREDKAMTRSGLLFAGANIALMGKKLPNDVDDGILTAKEISNLDLRGLDLVVLSACQTGLGEITGDGVLGLQRGFKKAGAGSLIMSLWKVDDEATHILMTQLYKNLASGKSEYNALHDAQNYLRNYEVIVDVQDESKAKFTAHAKEQANKNKNIATKIQKKYSDPKYWAAFVLLDAIEND